MTPKCGINDEVWLISGGGFTFKTKVKNVIITYVGQEIHVPTDRKGLKPTGEFKQTGTEIEYRLSNDLTLPEKRLYKTKEELINSL